MPDQQQQQQRQTETRILPRRWDVLNLPDKSTKYLFGFHYSKTKYAYTIYVTDLTRVWMADADVETIELKAMQHALAKSTLVKVYEIILMSFENNFNGSDTETRIELEKKLIEGSYPLQMTLKMEKVYSNDTLNWSFDLVRLPENSAISILKNIIFQLSTIVCSLDEYRKDLSHRIEQKDSAIRFLSETLEGMNASNKIKIWAPERSANATLLKSFDQSEFDKSWRSEKLQKLQSQRIWDVLKSNSDNNTWSLGTFLIEGHTRTSSISSTASKESESPTSKKRQLEGNSEDNEYERTSNFQMKRTNPPPKKRRTENLADLTEDLKECDLESEYDDKRKENHVETETPRVRTPTPTPDPVDHQLNSSLRQPSQQAPENRKRYFGQSRKRRINQKMFSPIKTAKYFQSED